MVNEGAIHVLPLVSEFTAREGTSLTTTGYESLYCALLTRVAYTEKEQSSPPHAVLYPARHTLLLGKRRGLLRNWTLNLFWPFSPLPGCWDSKQKTLFSTAMTGSFRITCSPRWDQQLASERNGVGLVGPALWWVSQELVNKESEDTIRESR